MSIKKKFRKIEAVGTARRLHIRKDRIDIVFGRSRIGDRIIGRFEVDDFVAGIAKKKNSQLPYSRIILND